MEILRKKLTRTEFADYLSKKNFGSIPPTEIVLHHTWRPTKESWKGASTIDGLKRYYESLGWPVGPHIFVAEDGIWLFTDMAKVGIHAGTANATWEKNGQLIGGYNVAGGTLKSYSVGVEIVGDYDEHVWEGETLKNALSCLASLKENLGIYNEGIKFHRDYSPKSCPGNAINRDWLAYKLTEYEQGNIPESGYEFKFSKEEAQAAQRLGFLKQIDTEHREITAIGLYRVYKQIKKEARDGTLDNDITI